LKKFGNRKDVVIPSILPYCSGALREQIFMAVRKKRGTGFLVNMSSALWQW
jgi:hypothetical protein